MEKGRSSSDDSNDGRKVGRGYGGRRRRRVRWKETYRILHPNAPTINALAFHDVSASLTSKTEMRIRAASVMMSIVPMMPQRTI
jgi:hypothetical protein